MPFKYSKNSGDLYTFLKVDRTAGPEDIHAARIKFRDRVAQYAPGLTISEQEFAALFPEVNEGFSILSDPVRKSEYDQSLLHPRHIKDPVPSAEAVGQGTELPPTWKQKLSDAAAYAGFLILAVLALLFLYLLADFSL